MRAETTCGFAKRSVRTLMTLLGRGICFGLLAVGLTPPPAAAADHAAQSSSLSRRSSAPEGAALQAAATPSGLENRPQVGYRPGRANFERERASREARQLGDWIVDSRDNRGLPFAIVDKTDAKVFVFDAHGRLRGAAAALLGLARGDDAVPGIGDRPLSSMRPEERTTPAGRFVSALDRSIHGKVILWVDYDDAISMHPVITSNPAERRAQRLATPTPLDNRISYGCINVPPKFFDSVVRPAFTGTDGIVYVLPETKPARVVFASYDVDERARMQNAGLPVPAQLASGAMRQSAGVH